LDKNFIAVDDYIAPEEADPSHSPTDLESSSSESPYDIVEKYLERHCPASARPSANISSLLLGNWRISPLMGKDTTGAEKDGKERS
jgi:hypothetical protein